MFGPMVPEVPSSLLASCTQVGHGTCGLGKFFISHLVGIREQDRKDTGKKSVSTYPSDLVIYSLLKFPDPDQTVPPPGAEALTRETGKRTFYTQIIMQSQCFLQTRPGLNPFNYCESEASPWICIMTDNIFFNLCYMSSLVLSPTVGLCGNSTKLWRGIFTNSQVLE